MEEREVAQAMATGRKHGRNPADGFEGLGGRFGLAGDIAIAIANASTVLTDRGQPAGSEAKGHQAKQHR
jgi:hypothetical protein